MRTGRLLRARSATLFERAWAYLVDSLVTFLLWLSVSLLIAGGDLEGLIHDPVLSLTAGMLFLVVPLAYFVVAEATLGTTVGKRIFGLHLERSGGAPVGWFQATVRNLLRLAWALGPLGPLLLLADTVLVQLTEQDARVGDLAAGTRVVRRGPAVVELP